MGATLNKFPFAGSICERPYPVSGLTTSRWKTEVGLKEIDFDKIILTQDGVNIFRLFNEIKLDETADDYPHIIVFEDVLYLEDGHHRVCRAALKGNTSLVMRVYKVG